MAPDHTSKAEVRNLTNITDTDILSDSDLDTLVEKANRKAERELKQMPVESREDAAFYWACHLVARKLRGATAVEQDDDITLRTPEGYKEDYMSVKEGTPPTSDVMSRASTNP